MEKEFVKYEQALALKELGFNESCLGIYYGNGDNEFMGYSLESSKELTNKFKELGHISAPLYQQTFRWFREKQYYSEINVGCTQIDGAIGFSWRIWKPWLIEEWSPERPGEEWSYETYEEAESACLDKLIEIIKNK